MPGLHEIVQICHQEKFGRIKNDGPLRKSYILHRHIAKYLTYFFLNFTPRVRPNHISVLMILSGLAGAILVSLPDGKHFFVGLGIIYFSFLLDKVDGDISRYKQIFSTYGKYLDEIYHVIPQPLIYFSFGFHVYLSHGDVWSFALAIFCHLLAAFNRIAPKLALLYSSDEEWRSLKRDQILTERRGGAAEVNGSRESAIGSNVIVFMRFDLLLVQMLLTYCLATTVCVPYHLYIFRIFFCIHLAGQLVRCGAINLSIRHRMNVK